MTGKMSRRKLLIGASVLSTLPSAAWAQGERWPARPIRVLVGFPAGQATDIIARTYCDELGREFGQVFNVGNTEEVSIRALAERILGITGSASPIVTIPYEEAYESGFEDMPRRVPDLSKLAAAIGYQPQVHLDEIIQRVVDSQREVRPHAHATPSGSGAPRAAGV